jgi:hypothetical protein
MFMNETFMERRASLDRIAICMLVASQQLQRAGPENALLQPAFRHASVK